MRLGFSVRVWGRPDLPAYDPREGNAGDQFSMNLAYLRDILHYLGEAHIHMYRLHSGLATPLARLEPGEQQREIEAWVAELEAVGQLARRCAIRLSFHPYSVVMLSALNEDQWLRSAAYLHAQAALLDALGQGPEAVIVVHVGGVYDDAAASRERFARRYAALPEAVRRRVVLEHDDHRFSFADVMTIHRACGVPLVFDQLHHWLLNPVGLPWTEALRQALATWPAGLIPKIHFTTPRTELRPLEGAARLKAPSWTEHSDFINPFEFIAFLRATEGAGDFDVMLEAKGRDLALLQLRQDMQRFAPELASRLQ